MLIAFTTDDLYCISFVRLLWVCHSLNTSMAQALGMVKRGSLSLPTMLSPMNTSGMGIASLNDKEDLAS